ncbi:MAG: hypothetical protein WDW36_009111 [Sanguina aurantia]
MSVVPGPKRGRKDVAQLLEKVHRVESAISGAEAVTGGAQRQLAAQQQQQQHMTGMGGEGGRAGRSPARGLGLRSNPGSPAAPTPGAPHLCPNNPRPRSPSPRHTQASALPTSDPPGELLPRPPTHPTPHRTLAPALTLTLSATHMRLRPRSAARPAGHPATSIVAPIPNPPKTRDPDAHRPPPSRSPAGRPILILNPAILQPPSSPRSPTPPKTRDPDAHRPPPSRSPAGGPILILNPAILQPPSPPPSRSPAGRSAPVLRHSLSGPLGLGLGPGLLQRQPPVGPARAAEHMKGAPSHTPLSSVLSQYKEAETVWAQEKGRLRREALAERKRANKNDLELQRLSRLTEHKSLDIKALKIALRNRDVQLEDSHAGVKALEDALSRTQQEASLALSSLSAERDDLKALLLAALQRLEAVDGVVQRADVSTAMMEQKVRGLEEERLQALEAAARARAEVSELTENRRKLQWQSKLLEKMSEVQLKHNKRKSDAIKKLLNADTGGSYDMGDDLDSDGGRVTAT